MNSLGRTKRARVFHPGYESTPKRLLTNRSASRQHHGRPVHLPFSAVLLSCCRGLPSRGATMSRFLQSFLLCVLLSLGVVAIANAAPAEKRIALVIGNGDYKAGALRTAAND